MEIFIGQLIGFAIIVYVLVRFVVPPVRKAMTSTQDSIAAQIAESDEAKKRLAEATAAHANAVEEARAEASRIREEARADAQAISVQMAEQADAEVKRITEHGKSQVALNRTTLVRQLRSDLGLASVDLAGKLVRDHLANPAAQQDSVDRVITELGQMVGSDSDAPGSLRVSSAADLVGIHSMRAASRDSVLALAAEFDRVAADADPASLTALSTELTDAVALLTREPVLRKHLAEPSDDTAPKEALVHGVFGSSLSAGALSLVRSAALSRWSSVSDLTFALERVARFALFSIAEKAGTIETVEDELFRFGRLLYAQPQLSKLLSDHHAPVDGRLSLLGSVLAGRVDTTTDAVLTQTVRLLRGQPAAAAVTDLAEIAAARRGESVAHVVAAAPLTDDQRSRLTEVLGRVYNRPMSLQVELDPALLGGLRITVGDEVIDGDIATRLAKAAAELP
ncbi:F0F1 ATP synthase subunit B/delta [Williamsia sp. CHRR-6]|uniref:F0F1 ATP synthase subunit B/delta n=1 Tax=Williamsia sp. CHRR-6 TaxID=2835871 RepID=UPI001BD9688D|nr:F0F1 ATP synthase subunit B/delta [Williamsia sp. CHRR-6]MBT0568420.1 F0F1 ATP synthase subunit B/delta [Williamsia sp. CHRR-6]